MIERVTNLWNFSVIRFGFPLSLALLTAVAPQAFGQSVAPEVAPAAPQETVQRSTSREAVTAPVSEGAIKPEEIPARIQALSERLDSLRKANLPKEELEKVEAAFGRVLKMLAELQDAIKRREGYQKSIAEIPQRLEQVGAQQQTEERAQAPEFEEYTEGLLNEYTSKVNALQTELQNLTQESSQGDIRAARLPEEIGELGAKSAELGNRLQALGYSPGQAQTNSDTNAPMSEAQELALERQLVNAQAAALEAEREWLTKRRPLQDRLIGLARLKEANAERDLGVINQRLLETVSAQRRKLRDELAAVEKKMTESQSRAETLLLSIHRKTIETKMETLDLIEQSKGLRTELLEEEKLTARMNQDKDRLVALMEKYGAGEWVAQRVMVDLEEFRRAGEKEVQNTASEAKLQEELREANKQLFDIGSALFEADERGTEFQRELSQMNVEGSPASLRALRSEARRLVEEQKQALEKQEQILTERVQALTKLIELDRQQEELVKGLYTFVLTRILWLRNREPLGPYPLNIERFRLAADAAISYARRVYVYARSARLDRLREGFQGSPLPYVAFALFFGLLPVAVIAVRRRAKSKAEALLQKSALDGTTPGIGSFSLVMLIAAAWPAYLLLFSWVRSWFVADLDPVMYSFRDVMRLSALVLWVLLFARHLLKQQGWGMQYWRLTREASSLLRWTIRIACYAAFLLLVPRYALLSTPELGGSVEASLALTRILLMSFQLVFLVLLAVLLRRNSSFTQWLLGQSHQQRGFLWQIWPILYLLVLLFLGGIISLNVAGYQYAATFFWERSELSLAVGIAFWAVFSVGRGIIAAFIHRQAVRAGISDGNERAIKVLNASLGLPLFVVAVAAVMEVWGFSVLDFVATPLGKTLLWRGLFIAAVIALAVIVIHLTDAIVMSLLRPKILAEGRTREAGRKLQTIGPLTQTIVKVGVILIAFLVVLQQIGIDPGPILAGVGIFGLAIGFAAQSLIKDVINGLFILFEGSLAVGDIVSVGGIGGQVEKVTLRSVRVRDLGGNVHFIPNSTIDRVENMTKDFSRYLMEVGVAYREDTDEVVSVMRAVDEEMRSDPLFKWDMLEPIEILGVDRFADSAVIVKARLKTRPMQQWRTGREYNRRLKKAFDQRGIEIPFPHRTVYWGETKQGQRPLQIDVDSRGPEDGQARGAGFHGETPAQNADSEARKSEEKKTA